MSFDGQQEADELQTVYDSLSSVDFSTARQFNIDPRPKMSPQKHADTREMRAKRRCKERSYDRWDKEATMDKVQGTNGEEPTVTLHGTSVSEKEKELNDKERAD